MLDYYQKKLFVDSPSSPVLCGYPKKELDEEGFVFLKKILNSKEQKWLDQVNVAAWDFFHDQPEQNRKNFVLSYELTVKTENGVMFVLHHTITPFRLCGNGNLWLGLCHVVLSSSKRMMKKAHIVDTKTGKTYNFFNGNFILSDLEVLSHKEKQILTLLARDMTGQQISEALGMPLTVYNRHKRNMFDKLGVDKAVTAIHKAHIEGLI